ncbi:hypothetical protein ESCO_000657 [Escovopsis weberi]|uniref:PhoD-like phosphatase metallophosphatase domain-containing protein n=1 Tax=Escovopsis weberi TaxID=150374 RepID=A0A0M8N1R4_ESCWE|nr:hypothetical protein ESCO_000657 [Escovopsis weberi]
MSLHSASARITSAVLRIGIPIFLRLGALSHLIFSIFAVYTISYIVSFLSSPKAEPVEDRVDIVVGETVVAPENSNDRIVVEQIDTQETITLEEQDVSVVGILLSGVPSPRKPIASIFTFLINLLLVGFTADYVYRGRLFPATDLSFVRLGYVSPEEARFLMREPDQLKMPVTLEMRLKGAVEPAESSVWQLAAAVARTTEEDDFTAVVSVPFQHVDERRYEWRTSNNHTGEFLIPPQPGKMSAYNDGKFTFLSTSCILPRFPYNPLDDPLAIPGVRHLARRLPELKAQFMLFLGDFIYIDVPQRYNEASEPTEYMLQYRQVYASPDWALVGQNLSWIHVLDDHEISNGIVGPLWPENYSSSNETPVYKAAAESWNIYQAAVNPPRAKMAGKRTQQRPQATWFEFIQGPASFFMLDTRSYRSSNTRPYDESEKTMLGPDQLEDLLGWLARPEPSGVRWKVVASSVPFTKNWPVNVRDTWGGFLVERQEVLEAMWDTSAQGYGVIILSGDRHEFAATKFPPPPESKWNESSTVYEFSTSPLSQFASPFPSYRQTDQEDVMIKYLHAGNSKFGSFTFENKDGNNTLFYQLYIDGEEAWNTTVVAPPLPESGPRAAAEFLWGKVKGFLDKATY